MNQNKKENTNKKTKGQKYSKTLDFYKIVLAPSLSAGPLETELKNQLEKVYSNSPSYTHNGIIYEKIFSDDNCFFGYAQKTSSPKDLLTKIKDKKTKKTLNIDELIFEHRTYFFIDFKHEAISFIKTKNFQNLLGLVNLFSYNSALNVDFIPFKKNAKEIDSFNASTLNLTVYDPDEFIEIKGINKNDAEIEAVTIECKLKKRSPKFMENIRNLAKNSHENIKGISVSSNDENLDVIRGLFTKHAIVELTEEDSINKDNIKNILCQKLLEVVKT